MIDKAEFMQWLKYGNAVVPYFEYRIHREFNISYKTLKAWLNGAEAPYEATRHNVVKWLQDNGLNESKLK